MSQPPDELGQSFRAQLAKVTGGLAPEDYAHAFNHWWTTLAADPARQTQLAHSGAQRLMDFWSFALKAVSGEPAAPAGGKAQFANPAWKQWPFNVWRTAIRSSPNGRVNRWASPGICPPTPRSAWNSRCARCSIRPPPPTTCTPIPSCSPSDAAESGANLARGLKAWLDDAHRQAEGRPPAGVEKFRVGEKVAVTPGKVVLRNELIELIQYAPADAGGARRADTDRAGVDHEVLHPRSLAAQLAGALPGRAGPHGVHDLVEEPDAGGPRARHGRLRAPRLRGRPRRRQRHRAGTRRACGGLLHRRHAAGDRGRARSRPQATRACAAYRCSRRRPTSANRASCRCSSRRRSWRCSKR